jgi:hypothetical protein
VGFNQGAPLDWVSPALCPTPSVRSFNRNIISKVTGQCAFRGNFPQYPADASF